MSDGAHVSDAVCRTKEALDHPLNTTISTH